MDWFSHINTLINSNSHQLKDIILNLKTYTLTWRS